MRHVFALVAAVALLAPACKAAAPQGQSSPAPAAASALQTEDDKTFYALGSVLGSRLTPLKLSQEELDKIILGFQDAAAGRKAQVPTETYGPKIDSLLRGKATAGAQ